jgi:hypothetical protein
VNERTNEREKERHVLLMLKPIANDPFFENLFVDGEIEENIFQGDIGDETSFAFLREFQHLVDVSERGGFIRLFRLSIGVDQKILSFEITKDLRFDEMTVVSMMFQGVGKSNEHFLMSMRMKRLQAQFDRSPRIRRLIETREKNARCSVNGEGETLTCKRDLHRRSCKHHE